MNHKPLFTDLKSCVIGQIKISSSIVTVHQEGHRKFVFSVLCYTDAGTL